MRFISALIASTFLASCFAIENYEERSVGILLDPLKAKLESIDEKLDNITIGQTRLAKLENLSPKVSMLMKYWDIHLCPAGFVKFKASCYHFGQQKVKKIMATVRCLSYGARLFDLESVAEERFITRQLSTSSRKSELYWTSGNIGSKLLTTDHVSLLRKWFPGKAFKLLYRASRDGMKGSTFHSKCNNKGPTISIGTDSKTGTVYGGYASVSWRGTGGFKRDSNAFLFRMCGQECTSARYSQYRNYNNALYENSIYGPTFGGGHDLLLFSGSNSHMYDSTNKYFPSNGYCNTNRHTYNGKLGCGWKVKWTDVEVWSVIDGNSCLVFNPSTKDMEKKSCSYKARYICEI